jgi:hypothetical protein
LFLDDLDSIVSHLERNTKLVTLTAGTAMASDGVADLKDATRSELRRVKIVTSDPALTIDLTADAGKAETTVSTDEAKALVDDVHALVSARRSWRPILPYWAIATAMSLALFGAPIAFAAPHHEMKSRVVLFLAIGLGFSTLYFLVALRAAHKGGGATITPEYRRERRIPRTTRATLLGTLIGAIVTGTVTLIVAALRH